MEDTSYAHLLPPSWKTQIAAWLAEDTPSFDYGGFVVGEARREAYLLGKGSQRAVLAGAPFVDEIFRELGCECVRHYLTPMTETYSFCRVEWHLKEGAEFDPVFRVATVRGPARQLLLGERVALNLLARCSGIATMCVACLPGAHTRLQSTIGQSVSRISRLAMGSRGSSPARARRPQVRLMFYLSCPILDNDVARHRIPSCRKVWYDRRRNRPAPA